MRWIRVRVMDAIGRNDTLFLIIVVAPGIQIAAPAREIGARYFQPNPVTGPEIVAGRVQIEVYFIHFALLHPDLAPQALTKAHPLSTFLQIEGAAIRPFSFGYRLWNRRSRRHHRSTPRGCLR